MKIHCCDCKKEMSEQAYMIDECDKCGADKQQEKRQQDFFDLCRDIGRRAAEYRNEQILKAMGL